MATVVRCDHGVHLRRHSSAGGLGWLGTGGGVATATEFCVPWLVHDIPARLPTVAKGGRAPSHDGGSHQAPTLMVLSPARGNRLL